MSSANFSFNSVGQLHQAADTKKNDSATLRNSATSQRDSYAKWAVISAIAIAGIAGVAILAYRYAQSPGSDSYLGDLNDHPNGYCLKVSQGSVLTTMEPGCDYVGDWQEGLTHGKGVYTCQDGTRYEGDWQGGFRHGKGVYTSAIGRYEGDWQNGREHGSGVITWPKCSYKGDWQNGGRHGKGVFICQSGVSYEGDWKYDRQHGQGVSTEVDGSRHVGEFAEGFFVHGTRFSTSADGSPHQIEVDYYTRPRK